MITSNSDDNISYQVQLIVQSDYEQLNDPDYEWIHFLQDHRDLIRSNSRVVEVNETNMTLYRYRPRKFLANNESKEELELAFRVVNRIGDDMSFTEKNYQYVYIPTYTYIFELRRRYVTLKYQEDEL